jgi:hypothetical protein
MKKLLLIISLIVLSVSAKANRIEWGKNVIISKPVYEDLYIIGGTIVINAPVYGDLIVAGGNITINDTIKNDILLAGGEVMIRGYVADDIRCAGGKLIIQSGTGGDLVVTGGTVEVMTGVTIGGSLMVSGGDVKVNGDIKEDIRSTAGSIAINGTVGRNLDIRSSQIIINGSVVGYSVLSANKIVIGDKAFFGSYIRYWNKVKQLEVGQNVGHGKIVFDPSLKLKTNSWYYLGYQTVIGMFWYISTVLLFMLIFQYLFSASFKKAGETIDQSSGKSLTSGLIFFLGMPVAILVLLITLIGIPFGLLLMLSYVTLLLLAKTITALVMANWYNNHFNYHWKFWKTIGSAMVLFILFTIISFTPFLGWLVMLLIASVAFGAIIRNINWRKRSPVAIS